MIKINIPGKPRSVNHLYRNGVDRKGRPRRYLTTDGKAWKKAVAACCLEQCGRGERAWHGPKMR